MDGFALNSTPSFLDGYISRWQANYRPRRETMEWLVGSQANTTPCTATHTCAKKRRAFVSFSRILRFRVVVIRARMGWDGMGVGSGHEFHYNDSQQ